MKEAISITVDKEILKEFDKERGITKRSSLIEKLMEDWVNEQRKG